MSFILNLKNFISKKFQKEQQILSNNNSTKMNSSKEVYVYQISSEHMELLKAYLQSELLVNGDNGYIPADLLDKGILEMMVEKIADKTIREVVAEGETAELSICLAIRNAMKHGKIPVSFETEVETINNVEVSTEQ